VIANVQAWQAYTIFISFASDLTDISEISPAKHRGELVTWSEIGINVGICMGYATGLLFDGYTPGSEWRAMCLMGMMFPLTIIILTIGIVSLELILNIGAISFGMFLTTLTTSHSYRKHHGKNSMVLSCLRSFCAILLHTSSHHFDIHYIT
jgi:peptidoglycan/LPS O-acetylase OafA/YrhL